VIEEETVAYEVMLKELPAQPALVAHMTVTLETIGPAMAQAFGQIMAQAQACGAQFAGPPFAMYPDPPGGEFRLILCMPVLPGAAAGGGVELEDLPGGSAATTMHHGSYSGIAAAYQALEEWMKENGRQAAGPPREVYLTEPGTVAESDTLTEVQWPVF
jgi:AraC family transcriptional regulator